MHLNKAFLKGPFGILNLLALVSTSFSVDNTKTVIILSALIIDENNIVG